MVVAHDEPTSATTKRRPVRPKSKPTRSMTQDLSLSRARKKITENFKENMAALQKSQSPSNAVCSVFLGKTKGAIAFEVLDATKRMETVIPSARLPFSLRCRLGDPTPLTAEVLNAKLLRAKENRLRELERVKACAARTARSPGKDNNAM